MSLLKSDDSSWAMSSLARQDGVQWQIDIAGLTNLLAGAGVKGLKQLALAGVDPHTLGCLLMIGELTPTCSEFRMKLNRCRQRQRASRLWLYHAIEIGTATNFLADELLKRRAGENVLALLTAVMPILSENNYTDTMSLVFTMSKIGADSTPGVGQLQRLRAALLPFTTAVDIKNRVLVYHSLFREHSGVSVDPCDAIPKPEHLSQLILTFSKMMTSTEDYRLIYRGTRGAAWTAAYARDILGLQTCMLRHSNGGDEPIPISADYEDSKVVFYLNHDGASLELWKHGNMESAIEPLSVDANGLQWVVDCDAVNYFAFHHPSLLDSLIQHKISEFVGAKVMDCVAELCCDLSFSVNTNSYLPTLPESLITYQRSVLPFLQKRSLRILRCLGFTPPEWATFKLSADGSTTGLHPTATSRRMSRSSIVTDDRRPSLRSSLGESRKFSNASDRMVDTDDCTDYWQEAGAHSGTEWWSPELEIGFERYLEQWQRTVDEDPNSWLDINAIITTAKNATQFASYLAFTDWHVALRRMSINFFHGAVQFDGGTRGNINAKNNMRKIQMFCTAHPSPEPLFWSFGQELSGLVLLRHIPLSHSIQEGQGVLVNLRPGQILYDGERCAEISPPDLVKPTGFLGISVKRPLYAPHCVSSMLKISTSCRLADGRVFLATEALPASSERIRDDCKMSNMIMTISPELVGESMSRLLITRPCKHWTVEKDVTSPVSWECLQGYTWFEGLALSVPRSSQPVRSSKQVPVSLLTEGAEHIRPRAAIPMRIFYQAVKDHDLGQWLALHVSASEPLLYVMQKEACLDCTLRYIGEYKATRTIGEREDVCIIAGSYASEQTGGAQDGEMVTANFLARHTTNQD